MKIHKLLRVYKTLSFIYNHPLNKNMRIKAIQKFINWQIGSRLVPGDVIVPWISDSKFIAQPGEHGVTQNIYCGLAEFQDMGYALHVLTPDDIFIDIGANVGSYTIIASAARHARTICFEPIPETYNRLLKNIQVNNIQSLVTPNNCGVSDVKGELLFTSTQNTMNHALSESESLQDSIRINVLPLDVLLENINPTFIKIDVEGMETKVINGAKNTLQKPSLNSIIMEVNGSGERYGFTDSDIIKTITNNDFQPYTYKPFEKELSIINSTKDICGNIIFIRDESVIKNKIETAERIKINNCLL